MGITKQQNILVVTVVYKQPVEHYKQFTEIEMTTKRKKYKIISATKMNDFVDPFLIWLGRGERWCEINVVSAFWGTSPKETRALLLQMVDHGFIERREIPFSEKILVKHVYGMTERGFKQVRLPATHPWRYPSSLSKVTERAHFSHKQGIQLVRLAYEQAGASLWENSLTLSNNGWNTLLPDGYTPYWLGYNLAIEVEFSEKHGDRWVKVLRNYCELIEKNRMLKQPTLIIVYYSKPGRGKKLREKLDKFKEPLSIACTGTVEPFSRYINHFVVKDIADYDDLVWYPNWHIEDMQKLGNALFMPWEFVPYLRLRVYDSGGLSSPTIREILDARGLIATIESKYGLIDPVKAEYEIMQNFFTQAQDNAVMTWIDENTRRLRRLPYTDPKLLNCIRNMSYA
jgi:hypothetical protein